MVSLNLDVAGETYRWRARIVRAEGAVDERSRQLFVVAQINNPYGRTNIERPPLKIGSFVQAEIMGRVLEDVFVIPRSLLRENSYVLLVHSDEKGQVLRRRPVTVAWETDEVAVISKGLTAGEMLCLTQVPLALENYPVSAVPEKEDSAADEAVPVQRRGPPRTAASAGAGGAGGFVEALMAAIPADQPLPPELKAKLDDAMAAAAAGDRSKMRPVMAELREWAEANDIELPAGRGR